MKKNILYSAAMLLVAASAMTACSNEESAGNTAQKWTLNVQASKGGSDSRVLTDNGTTLLSTWSTSDNVAVVNSDNNAEYGLVSPTTTGQSSTKLTGTMTSTPKYGFEKGSQLKLYFPASAFTTSNTVVFDYTGQDGTLATIASKYDYCLAYVTIQSYTDNDVTVTSATFTSQQSIAGFKFYDKANPTTQIKVKTLNIKDNNNYLYRSIYANLSNGVKGDLTITLTSATTNMVYVAMKSWGGSNTYTFTVTDDNNATWQGTATAHLVDGKFYPAISIKLSKQ